MMSRAGLAIRHALGPMTVNIKYGAIQTNAESLGFAIAQWRRARVISSSVPIDYSATGEAAAHSGKYRRAFQHDHEN